MNAKRILRQKRPFGTRFRETVTTNAVLMQNECKTYFALKDRFGTRNSDNIRSFNTK